MNNYKTFEEKFAYVLTGMTNFTDFSAFETMAETIQKTSVIERGLVSLVPNLVAGVNEIPIVKSSNVIKATVDGSWTDTGGSTTLTKASLPVYDFELKETLSRTALRATYQTMSMTPGGLGDLPFQQVLLNHKADLIRKSVEEQIFVGATSEYAAFSGFNGLITSGNGAVSAATSAAFSNTNALTLAFEIADAAIAIAKNNSEELVMYMSQGSFNSLTRACIEKNYFNTDFISNVNQTSFNLNAGLIIPGTSVLAVPVLGLGTSQRVFCGPKKYLVVGSGLTPADTELMMIQDMANTAWKILARYRLGVAVPFVDQFVTNGR